VKIEIVPKYPEDTKLALNLIASGSVVLSEVLFSVRQNTVLRPFRAFAILFSYAGLHPALISYVPSGLNLGLNTL